MDCVKRQFNLMLKILVCNVHIVVARCFTKNVPRLPNALNQNSDCMKNATFVFVFDSADEARIVSESLSPEITHKIPKTNVTISLLEDTLSLTIESSDTSSLRAACNSYLRWINTALNVKKIV